MLRFREKNNKQNELCNLCEKSLWTLRKKNKRKVRKGYAKIKKEKAPLKLVACYKNVI